MSWANDIWNEWGAARGFYKGGLTVDGTAQYICQDVQLKYGAGAIVEGTVTVLEPLNSGADEEIWKVEISLPGYTERWEATKGARRITCTYLDDDDAGDAGFIVSRNPINSVEYLAVFATEYLHELDIKEAYPAYRDVMKPEIIGGQRGA